MINFLKSPDEVLSVGEFSARLKKLIKITIPEFWIRGEISNLKQYASGHFYFSLKDESASISAVLFKGYANNVELKLRDGMKILAFGEVSLYEQRGNYQFVVKAVLADGQGELALRFQMLKDKLEREGLFDESRKKTIPKILKKVAVITSATGAAIRDFVSIISRRKFAGIIDIYPSLVQGELAPRQLLSQLNRVENMGYDLVILMRGGGSLEDLWAFNDEALARRIANYSVPTISAVGHQIDFTLSDFCADLRAETPSAAAEYITANLADKQNSFSLLESNIRRAFAMRIEDLKEDLNSKISELNYNNSLRKIQNLNLVLDEKQGTLDAKFSKKITSLRNSIYENSLKLSTFSPQEKLKLLSFKLSSIENKLDLMSVENTLNRGFTVLSDTKNNTISHSKDTKKGEPYTLRFSDDSIEVTRI
ncbi:MAG: exodeoxyribonuclease VII large subunit [Opitutales bacterium]